jgi:hypothetical protein
VKRAGPLLLLVAACGGGPELSKLRCRANPCQDVEDPLKLLLAVDFIDDSGTLDKGALDQRVNGSSQRTVKLAGVFTAQGIAPGTKRGTLLIDDDIALDRITQGAQVQVGMVATNGQGKDSNEPTITFTLHLGGR